MVLSDPPLHRDEIRLLGVWVGLWQILFAHAYWMFPRPGACELRACDAKKHRASPSLLRMASLVFPKFSGWEPAFKRNQAAAQSSAHWPLAPGRRRRHPCCMPRCHGRGPRPAARAATYTTEVAVIRVCAPAIYTNRNRPACSWQARRPPETAAQSVDRHHGAWWSTTRDERAVCV